MRARLTPWASLWVLLAAGAAAQPAPPGAAPSQGPVVPVFLRSVARTDHTTLVGAWGPMDFWAASPLTSIAFSPDGRMLFAAARSGEIVGWDLVRFIPSLSLQAPSDADQGATLSVSPEGHMLLTPARRAPVALDVGGKRVRPLPFPPDCGEGRCPILGLGTFFGQGGIAVATKDSLLIWRRGQESGQVDAPRMKEGEAFSALAGAPREELLAMGTELGRLVLWDARTSKAVKQGAAHSGRVLAAQFTADGKKLLTAGADGFVKLWDAKKGTLLKAVRVMERGRREEEPLLGAVGFSPDGQLALTAAVLEGRPGSELSLWNLQTGRRTWKAQDLLTRSVAFSPDGRLAALVAHDRGADDPRRILLLEVQSGLSLLQQAGHLQRVTGLSVSPDGKWAVSASLDGTIKRWDAAAGTQTHVVGQHPGGVNDLLVSWKRQVAISAGADGAVRQWTLKPAEIGVGPPAELIPPRPLPAPPPPPLPPPGKKGGKAPPPPPPPPPSTGELLLDPRALSLSPDERQALLPLTEPRCAVPEGEEKERCAPVYRLRKWDLKEAHPLRDLYFADRSLVRPPCSAFLPELDEVLVGFDAVDAWTKKASPLRLFVRDDQGVPVRSFADPDVDTLRALVLQPSGDLVLVAADRLQASPEERKRGGAWPWNWRVGKKVRALNGHTDSVVAAAFSGDGQRLLTGSLDGTVRLWDTAGARELEQLDLKALLDDFPTSIAIAANAPTFLVGTEKGALLQFQLRR
ncbi:MAG TPA: WD40 repeat domain-containing protein [Myxococcales bacterium]|nr:WD40 repeat domain-containing protein [Myxococcales bacterium]